MKSPAVRVAVAYLVSAVVGAVIIGSFVGALHHPVPHAVPLAVVGQGAGELERAAAGAVEARPYGDAASARTAVLRREVEAAYLAGEGRLLVASAGGDTAAPHFAATMRRATGRDLAVEDVRPLSEGDSSGVSGMFYVLGLLLAALATTVLTMRMAPMMNRALRLAVLALGAVTGGLALTWVVDGLLGALTGAPFALLGVSCGVIFLVSVAVNGLMRRFGPRGVIAAAVLFIPIGLPASGGPFGAAFIEPWYAALGYVLPTRSALELVRSVVYFDGAALATPLTVLGLWAALGLVLMALPPRAMPRPAAPAPAAVPVAGAAPGAH
ncbi:hypothetical protein [Nonomuraea sp. WAC 01424]|uniref:hypothetical protein n=1 Tax=Nonomuraea sp. WAC 01424 TaxID=2203200 RepID=UPI000F7B9817|nr:hypothetical protein [Nonomuraea sp. WAC 01424]